MKNTVVLVLSLLPFILVAQMEQISVGPNYSFQIFYNLSDGCVSPVLNVVADDENPICYGWEKRDSSSLEITGKRIYINLFLFCK